MNLLSIISKRFNDSLSDFERAFQREVLLSESRRILLTSGLFGLALLAAVIGRVFWHESFIALYGSSVLHNYFILLFALGFLEEVGLFALTRHILKKHAASFAIPVLPRYMNALAEVSFITAVLVLMAEYYHPVHAFSTPAVHGYFLLIVLSVLRLDVWLSLFTGFMAATQYIIVFGIYVHTYTGPAVGSVLEETGLHISRMTMLILAGGAAAIATRQIRRNAMRSFRSIEERNQIKNLFGQQVSPEVVETLLHRPESLGGEQRFACVMFLDIRNYTPFAAGRTPQEIVQYLNVLFNIAVEAVHRQRGIINQFLGDGFMASFGVPVSRGNDSLNAVLCALDILAELKQAAQSSALPPTRVGIGIHCGEVISGNLGAGSRKQYSVTGNTVILASRIEQLNKNFNSQLLISEEVWQAIQQEYSGSPPRSLGDVTIKGRSEVFRLYKLA